MLQTQPTPKPMIPPKFEFKETNELTLLVDSAALLVQTEGEHAFAKLAEARSKWRSESRYVFVLDLLGNMLVHPDPELLGKNKID